MTGLIVVFAFLGAVVIAALGLVGNHPAVLLGGAGVAVAVGYFASKTGVLNNKG